MKMLSFLLFFLISIITTSQICFEKTFGGEFEEYCHSVKQTNDGGYILCGFTTVPFSGNGKDIYVLKTDEFGVVEWEQTYGGEEEDHGYYISKTNNGGYILCAESNSFGPTMAYLIEIDSIGDMLWSNTYAGNYRSSARQIIQTDDNGYIVCGTTYDAGSFKGDAFLFKTDEFGELIWSKTYGGEESDFAYSVSSSQDGGFILCGGTSSYGVDNFDMYILKLNAVGDTIWTKTIGGIGSDAAYSVLESESGEILIGGQTANLGGTIWDLIIAKLSPDGNVMWLETINYSGSENGCFISLTSDDDIIGCGWSSEFSMQTDVLIFKIDLDGELIWTNTFGGSSYEVGYAINETMDFGLIIAGYTQSYGAGMSDMYLVKTNSDGILTSIQEDIGSKISFKIYPNPFTTSTTIEYELKQISDIQFTVYNMMGERVHRAEYSSMPKGSHKVTWSPSHLPRGLYYAVIRSEGEVSVVKMVKQ